MKKYLFRGREIKTKKWVYGGFHEHQPSVTAIGKQPETEALIIADGNADWDLPIPINAYVVEKETVGEYSGLMAAKSYRGEREKDLRIFEGDIVRVITKLDEEFVGEIVFENGGWQIAVSEDDIIELYIHAVLLKKYRTIEIIGNIHDNKNLLEEAGRE
jgi:uncharacterized phage protein (TIGR01671 family)